MPLANPIPYGAVCPWPQNLRKLIPRKKHRNRIRVRVRSFVDGRILRTCSEADARLMCGENSFGNSLEGVEPKAVRLSRKKQPLTDIKLLAMERDEKPSACTLTKSDMLSNATGSVNPEFRKRARFSDGSINDLKVGNAIDRAMSKVEAWPETHDNRNTVISAGVAYGVFCQWPQQPERIVTFA